MIAATLVTLTLPPPAAASHGPMQGFFVGITYDGGATNMPAPLVPVVPGCTFTTGLMPNLVDRFGEWECIPVVQGNFTCAYYGVYVQTATGSVTGTARCSDGGPGGPPPTATATAPAGTNSFAFHWPGDYNFPFKCRAEFRPVLDSGTVFCWVGDP